MGELKTFLALLFCTSLVRKPEIENYWTKDEPVATPFFGRTMPRNRYQIIWRFLHFADNEAVDAAETPDRLAKVNPVLLYLTDKFKEMFVPGRNVSIDEGMLLWCGRLAFRVYNPQKPTKYGIKSYILCDSGTGYCYSLKPYSGQHSSLEATVTFLL